MPYRRLRIVVLLLVGLPLSPKMSARSFDASLCRIENRQVVLCFDLRDDLHPTAGLTLNISAPDKKELHVLLPFRTTAFETDQALLSTWGNYRDFTLINFFETSSGIHGIGFDPVFSEQLPLDEQQLSSTLTLQRLGLERRFIYSHHISSNAKSFPLEVQGIDDQGLDAIGVIRPDNAIGLELRNGRTEDPEAFASNGHARFYMAIDSKGSPNKIEVRYELPPTPFQTLILSYISKVAGAFAAPFVVILFLSVKESVRPKTRRIALWVFGMIQVAVILWLAYTAWSTRNQLATNAVADWTIVALTAVASAVPLWIKREQPAQQLPVKP
jgi:hypothetical protein